MLNPRFLSILRGVKLCWPFQFHDTLFVLHNYTFLWANSCALNYTEKGQQKHLPNDFNPVSLQSQQIWWLLVSLGRVQFDIEDPGCESAWDCERIMQWRIQDFPDWRGVNPWVWSRNLLVAKIFTESCVKMKEIEPGSASLATLWIRHSFELGPVKKRSRQIRFLPSQILHSGSVTTMIFSLLRILTRYFNTDEFSLGSWANDRFFGWCEYF